jgi:hypothetical protein
MAEGLSSPWLQFTMNLQGKAVNPLVLTGDGMNEEEFIRYNTENNIGGSEESASSSDVLHFLVSWSRHLAVEGMRWLSFISLLFSVHLVCPGPKRGTTISGSHRKWSSSRGAVNAT